MRTLLLDLICLMEDFRFVWGLLYLPLYFFPGGSQHTHPLRFFTKPVLRLANQGLSGKPFPQRLIFTLAKIRPYGGRHIQDKGLSIFHLSVFSFLQLVGANTPLRDSAPLRLSMFSGLRHLEINGCDLSTAAAKGLLDLKPRLETLTCINSTVRTVLERTFCGCWPWATITKSFLFRGTFQVLIG